MDLISRQAAIDAVVTWTVEDRPDIEMPTDLVGRIEALPSAHPELNEWCHDCKEYDTEKGCCPRWGQVIRTALEEAKPEQRWIPCSERLPEEPNMYTVTDSKGDVVRFIFYGSESSRKYWRRCAKAWMPLPEPWKGEDDERA